MKPKTIVKPPKRRGRQPGGIGNNALLYLCDNGVWYTQTELAIAIGMTPGGFGLRLRRYGWRHPEILTSSNRGKMLADHDQTTKTPEPDWEGLSTAPRAHNLAKIPTGLFEHGEYM